MAKRKKRLKKQEVSLLRQARKHRIKAKTEKGRKDTTHKYWLGEAERFELRAKQRAKILRRLKKRRKR